MLPLQCLIFTQHCGLKEANLFSHTHTCFKGLSHRDNHLIQKCVACWHRTRICELTRCSGLNCFGLNKHVWFQWDFFLCMSFVRFLTIAGFLKTLPFSRAPIGVYSVINNDDPYSFIWMGLRWNVQSPTQTACWERGEGRVQLEALGDAKLETSPRMSRIQL